MITPAADYWSMRYTDPEGVKHHRAQNGMIAKDFLHWARMRKTFADALSAKSLIEIGCGTGELSAMIKLTYDTKVLWGTDFSRPAVKEAQQRHPAVNFWVFDVLKDELQWEFMTAISSNTLEHFSDPHAVIAKMFELAPLVILIVPYQQPITDGYDAEGGAGHVYEFNDLSFVEYKLLDSFTFQTKGWQHSSSGEKPQQLAVLLER